MEAKNKQRNEKREADNREAGQTDDRKHDRWIEYTEETNDGINK